MEAPLSEPIVSEPSPRLITTGFEKKEREATSSLVRSLGDLDNYVRDFHAALTLFDFAEPQWLNAEQDHVKQWSFIACRDGAMTIYHFGQTFQHIRAALGSCPTINSLVDSQHLRLTNKKFESQFPDFEGLRHAIAHASDLWKNVSSFARNAFTGKLTGPLVVAAKGGRIAMRNNLINRQFSTTFETRLVSYEISAETLNRLISLKNEFYSAFRPAEEELRKLARAASRT